MFSKILTVASFALLAVATPTGSPAQSCSTGSVQCCDSVQPAGSPFADSLLELLGVVIQDIDVAVGITCTPITVIGAGADSCSSQTVCCQDDSFHGIVAIGCTPINLAL